MHAATFKIVFCSIQVLKKRFTVAYFQLVTISIITIIAPRWLERHEKSFITLATIIEVNREII